MTQRPRQRTWRTRLLFIVALWSTVVAWALWAQQQAPVGTAVLTPIAGWQLQVWLGSQMVISNEDGLTDRAPIAMIFYITPLTGTRLLARFTLPAWPLALSAGVVIAVAVAVARWPTVGWREERRGRRLRGALTSGRLWRARREL